MNIVVLSGSIDGDVKTSQKPGYSSIAFKLITQVGFGQSKRDCTFIVKRISKDGGKLAQYLTPGRKVVVSGFLSTDTYRVNGADTTVTVVNARAIELGSKPKSDSPTDAAPFVEDQTAGSDDFFM